jgi:hypothetical protein
MFPSSESTWRQSQQDLLQLRTLLRCATKQFTMTMTTLPAQQTAYSRCVTSGYRRDVDYICAPLGYHTALSGSSVPTFRDYPSAPSLSAKKIGRIGCPETSAQIYHSTLYKCNVIYIFRAALLFTLVLFPTTAQSLILCCYMFRPCSHHHGAIIL